MFNVHLESSCELITSESIRNYISGGRGIVTLESPTGKHHTYAFNAPREPTEFPENTLFVYDQVKSGVWLYVGMVDSKLNFRLTRSSIWNNDCEIVKGVKYILKMAKGCIVSTPMVLYHCGICSVCGRKLTSPKSILQGIGPTCRKHELSKRTKTI